MTMTAPTGFVRTAMVAPRAAPLAQGALLPAEEEVIVTNRRCCLVTPANKPLRPIVANVRDWLSEETRNDIRIVAKKFPRLGLREALQQTGLKVG